MKACALFLSILLLLASLTGCSLFETRKIESVIAPPVTDAPLVRDEVLLTDLKYGEYRLSGVDIPYYHWIESANEYLEVAGVRYPNGIFINPASEFENGFIEYDISSISDTYNLFICKVGKLDAYSGSGDPVIVSLAIDGRVLSRTLPVYHGEDAVLLDVEIPFGARTLRIECIATGSSACCSTVLCDGRFTHAFLADTIPWPE